MNNNRCFNCQAAAANGTWLNEFTLPEGTRVWACDDCIEEHNRIEAEADTMALKPICCEERARIIEIAQSASELVNRLTTHEQAGCAACSLGACDDCGASTPQSDLCYDLEANLHVCPTCNLKQVRIERIGARHAAEVRRVA